MKVSHEELFPPHLTVAVRHGRRPDGRRPRRRPPAQARTSDGRNRLKPFTSWDKSWDKRINHLSSLLISVDLMMGGFIYIDDSK